MIRARHNPFATHRVDALAYRFADGDWADVQARLRACGFRAAVIGAYGSGKTTFLCELVRRLSAQGKAVAHIFVNADRPRLTRAQWNAVIGAVKNRVVICIDGADLLPGWQRWAMRRLSYRAGGLIIAGHKAIGLSVLRICHGDPGIFQALLADLQVTVEASQARRIFDRHQGNVRDMFRDLYGQAARQDGLFQEGRECPEEIDKHGGSHYTLNVREQWTARSEVSRTPSKSCQQFQ